MFQKTMVSLILLGSPLLSVNSCADELRHGEGRPFQDIVHASLTLTSTAVFALQVALPDHFRCHFVV